MLFLGIFSWKGASCFNGGRGGLFQIGGGGASVSSGGFTLLGDIGIDGGFSEKS